MQELMPDTRLDNLTDWQPLQRSEKLAVLTEGLAKAGFNPETRED